MSLFTKSISQSDHVHQFFRGSASDSHRHILPTVRAHPKILHCMRTFFFNLTDINTTTNQVHPSGYRELTHGCLIISPSQIRHVLSVPSKLLSNCAINLLRTSFSTPSLLPSVTVVSYEYKNKWSLRATGSPAGLTTFVTVIG
jgi:hypothetical protein